MPISHLLKKVAMNKNKHLVLKGGKIVYHSGAKQSGRGTVARHHTGGEIAPYMSRLHLTGEGTVPPPKNFKRTLKNNKPIKFNF